MKYFVFIIIVVIGELLCPLKFDVVYSWDTHEGRETLSNLVHKQDKWGPHPYLAQWAIELFEKQSKTKLQDFQKKEIIWGSIEEDYNIKGTGKDVFEGVLEEDSVLEFINWDKNGLKNKLMFTRSFNHFLPQLDSIKYNWITDNRHTDAYRWAMNENGKNLRGYDTAVSKCSTDEVIAWRSLGHVIHLLCDMAVPAHVRGDPHPVNKPLERRANEYVRKFRPAINYYKIEPANSIEELFRKLAFYTSTNHYSADTINFRSDGPKVTRFEKDGLKYYFKSSNDRKLCTLNWFGWEAIKEALSTEVIENIIKGKNPFDAEKLFEIIQNKFGYLAFILDNEVTSEQWTDLAPKAIEYSAGLIKLFYDEIGPKKITDYFPIKSGRKYKYKTITKKPWGTAETITGVYKESFSSPIEIIDTNCYGRFWKGEIDSDVKGKTHERQLHRNREDRRNSCICFDTEGIIGIMELSGIIDDKISCRENMKISGKENYLLKKPLKDGTKWPVYSKVDVPDGPMKEVGYTVIKSTEERINVNGKAYSDCIVTETVIPQHKTSAKQRVTKKVSSMTKQGKKRSYYCKGVGEVLTVEEHISDDFEYNWEKSLVN